MSTFGTIGARESVRVLPYDIEVEYLESSGAQYIDTGVTPPYAATVAFAAKVGVSTNDGTRRFLCASSNSNNNHYTEIGGNMRFGVGRNYCNVTLQVSKLYDTETVFVPTKFDASIIVDGTTYTASSTASVTSNWYRLVLFRITAQYTGSHQMLGPVRISVNSNVVRDFIPVRKDSVGYMFDKVTRTMYSNAGTGSFILGPDKVGGGG